MIHPYSFVFLALGLAVTACGTEPGAAPLAGQWGAAEFEFVASGRTATLRLPCEAQARFWGAIVPDAGGRFEVTGPVMQRYGAARVHVAGEVNGPELRLTLAFTYEGGGGATTSALARTGTRPDFSQFVCLA